MLGQPLRRIVRRASAQLLSPPLGPASTRDRQLVEEFRDAVRQLPMPALSGDSRAEREWLDNQLALRRQILEADPRAFLHWDVIAKTMFVGWSPFVVAELRHLRSRPDWSGRWRPAIREAPVGRPARFPLHPRSSANLIHHAFHVCRFEETTGCQVTDFDAIVEFGGGYGSMCRLAANLGFRGRYLILDLPMFSALQRFYLRSLGLSVDEAADNRGDATADVRDAPLVQTSADLASAAPFAERARRTLFIATWSLSETPEDLRERLFDVVASAAGVLIGFQDRFEGIDNVRFFERWRARLASVLELEAQPIAHTPANRYLFAPAPRRQASGAPR